MSGTRLCGPATVAAIVVAALALDLALSPAARAQTSAAPARPMITRQVVETNAVRLVGNTRPEANAANDRGGCRTICGWSTCSSNCVALRLRSRRSTS